MPAFLDRRLFVTVTMLQFNFLIQTHTHTLVQRLNFSTEIEEEKAPTDLRNSNYSANSIFTHIRRFLVDPLIRPNSNVQLYSIVMQPRIENKIFQINLTNFFRILIDQIFFPRPKRFECVICFQICWQVELFPWDSHAYVYNVHFSQVHA